MSNTSKGARMIEQVGRTRTGSRWSLSLFAMFGAAVVLLAGCGTTSGGPAAAPGASPSASSAPTTPTSGTTSPGSTSTQTSSPTSTQTSQPTDPPTSTPTDTATPTQTKDPITEDTTLREGMSGPYVLKAQQQLSKLGYWLGTADGKYGYQTSQAVMALQKAAGIGRDGILGPKTKAALDKGVRPKHRTTSGSAIEVDKEHQLVLVVVKGDLRYILNTSTGSGNPYTSGGHTYVASTPEGRFSVQRQIDGMRVSHLGALWRPKYFTGGYALHGSPSVPGYPASHGCVRLSNGAINFLWSAELAPIGRTVWVY